MKKIILLVALTGLSLASFAQIEVGVNGGFSTTWLLNNNVSDQGPNLNPNASFGGSGGVTGTFFFNHTIGVGAEINFNSINQKYDGTVNDVNFDAADHLNYIQIPIMLKVKTESGFYFEVGPEWNSLSSAKGDHTSDPADQTIDYSGRSIKTGFQSSVLGIVFGFGGRFPITDHLALTAGLRFFGGLGDVTTELSEAEVGDVPFVNPEIGTAVYYAHHNQQNDYHYEKTTMATGGIQIGLFYAIGKNLKEDTSK